ncbi:MAG: HAD-IC family P-type ATPase [Cytophagaceae bacterium]|jgi:magnesium-transporting ATPase (P-type)|nr:HAD-IC family P-type ATPase [Cytophagaceae bacterium]
MKRYFNLPLDEVFQELKATTAGLSSVEAQSRLQHYGANVLPEGKQVSFFKILFNQFTSLLVLILLASGIITLFLQEYVDAGFIFLIVLINAFMGASQEWKAEQNASALQKMVHLTAKVLRDGKIVVLEASTLVPGDIVVLESGDKVPADLRLVELNALKIEEAILTGESLPVLKKVERIEDEQASVGDRFNMAYSGTSVTFGRAKGVVVATGVHTEIGTIAARLVSLETNKPPLVQRMEEFSQKISIYTLLLCLVAGVVAYARGMEWMDTFFLVIALAVSAIPEGLPIAITVALSIGSQRMSKRHVIIRKLAAVEGLGSCTVIATDKTGTLTLDQQTVQQIVLASGSRYECSGIGYHGDGTIQYLSGGEDPLALRQLLQYGVVCNEATLEKRETEWKHLGDAVDVALLAAAVKGGENIEEVKKKFNVAQQIPFESERKFAGIVLQDGTLVLKGAWEAFEPYVEEAERYGTQVSLLASSGYRVIALVKTTVDSGWWQEGNSLPTLEVIGFFALMDPVRDDVPDAIQACMEAGIKVAMVTGDHPETAASIARQIGIAVDASAVISGKQLQALQDEKGAIPMEVVQSKTVFARVSPEQKLRIVEAFKQSGAYVAVTGDGVNDAPALKSAHIGAAMGYGTDVAKEASSMIVVNNAFSSIKAAVEEGRYIYSNIRNVVYLLVSTGFAEIMTIIFTLGLNLPVPFTAIQLLWLNLVTNGIQDVAMAFEKGDTGEMKRKPRDPNESVFNRLMVQEVVLSSIVMSVAVSAVWYYLIEVEHTDIGPARSLVMLLMVLFQNLHVLNCRNELKSIFSVPLSNNWWLVGAIFLAHGIHVGVSYIPFMADVLELQPYRWSDWAYVLEASLSIIVVMELFKWVKRRKIKC